MNIQMTLTVSQSTALKIASLLLADNSALAPEPKTLLATSPQTQPKHEAEPTVSGPTIADLRRPTTASSGPTITDLRSLATAVSRAGKQGLLKELFAKYNADRLSNVNERDYANLYTDLKEVSVDA